MTGLISPRSISNGAKANPNSTITSKPLCSPINSSSPESRYTFPVIPVSNKTNLPDSNSRHAQTAIPFEDGVIAAQQKRIAQQAKELRQMQKQNQELRALLQDAMAKLKQVCQTTGTSRSLSPKTSAIRPSHSSRIYKQAGDVSPTFSPSTPSPGNSKSSQHKESIRNSRNSQNTRNTRNTQLRPIQRSSRPNSASAVLPSQQTSKHKVVKRDEGQPQLGESNKNEKEHDSCDQDKPLNEISKQDDKCDNPGLIKFESR